MGPFAAGCVIVLPFRFSDLSGRKFRPALLLADAGRGGWIACQITSNPYADARAMALGDGDFEQGGLRRASVIRPGKLFTASQSLFAATAGQVRSVLLAQARDAVVAILRDVPTRT